MIRVYLAGPITGIPDRNAPAFEAAAARLRASGYEVISPLEVNPDPVDWNTAMRKDIPHLCTCDVIALLAGWEKSKGTLGELSIARLLEMPEIYLAARPTTVDHHPV